MESQYLVFWYDGNENRASVVRLGMPPHEPPRGEFLEELLQRAIVDSLASNDPCIVTGGGAQIHGAVELRDPVWAPETSFELVVGNGRIGALNSCVNGWSVIL